MHLPSQEGFRPKLLKCILTSSQQHWQVLNILPKCTGMHCRPPTLHSICIKQLWNEPSTLSACMKLVPYASSEEKWGKRCSKWTKMKHKGLCLLFTVKAQQLSFMSVKMPYSLQSQLLLLCRAFVAFLRYLEWQNTSFSDLHHSMRHGNSHEESSRLHLNWVNLVLCRFVYPATYTYSIRTHCKQLWFTLEPEAIQMLQFTQLCITKSLQSPQL